MSSTTPMPAAAKRWIEARTEHFKLVSSASEDETRELARQMELFRAVVEKTSNARRFDERVPTTIYVFESRWDYRRVRPDASTAGFMIPTLRGNYIVIGPGGRGLDATTIVFHEYVHYLLRNQGSHQYPMWYDEGLAEMLSTVRENGEGVEVGHFPAHRGSASFSVRSFPLRRMMLATDSLDWGRQKTHDFYARSWLLVRFLHDGALAGGENRYPQLLEFLSLRNDGVDQDTAFARAFRTGYRDMETELQNYFEHIRKEGIRVTHFRRGELPAAAPATTIELSEPQWREELGALALVLGPDKADLAADHFERALEVDPSRARAHAGLGDARLTQERFDEAVDSYGRALSMGSDDPIVQLGYANLLTHLAAVRRLTVAQRQAEIDRARAHYRRCIDLDPNLPECYARFGATYAYTEEPARPGIALLENARSIFRWSTRINLELGRLYGKAGAAERALECLERVMQWSHSGGEREAARNLLVKIEAEKRRAVRDRANASRALP